MCPTGFGSGTIAFHNVYHSTYLSDSKVEKHKNHHYVNDTHIYVAITPDNASSAIPVLQKCLRSVQEWMAASKLRLNPEFSIFSLPTQQASLSHVYPFAILGNLLHPPSCVHKLCVLFYPS